MLLRADNAYKKAQYDSAILYAGKAIELLEKDSLAKAYSILGDSYYLKADLESALNSFLEVEKIYQSLNSNTSKIKGSIAILLHRMNRTEEALVYQKEALREIKRINDPEALIKMLLNIGLVHRKRQEPDSTLHYFKEALVQSREIKSRKWEIQVNSSLGNYYLDKHQYDTAMVYAQFVLNADSASKFSRAQSTFVMAKSYYHLAQYDSAMYYNDASFTLAKELGQPTVYGGIYELYSQIHQAMGNYKTSLTFYKKMHLHDDSLSTMRQKAELDELLTKYQTDKKEKEIQFLSQQNEIKDLTLSQQRIILIAVTVILVLLVGMGYFAYRQKRIVTLKKQLQLEQKLLRTQMNPHFIFNSLNSIQGFISSQENTKAILYIAKFGELTRDILEVSGKEWILLDDELRITKTYLDLERARFQKSLTFEVEIHCEDQEYLMFPPMLLQPFVENSIKHGFSDKDSGNILLEVQSLGKVLQVKITDNGRGLVGGQSNHKSRAVEITKERLFALNGYPSKSSLTIDNILGENEEIEGVSVSFELPLQYSI